MLFANAFRGIPPSLTLATRLEVRLLLRLGGTPCINFGVHLHWWHLHSHCGQYACSPRGTERR